MQTATTSTKPLAVRPALDTDLDAYSIEEFCRRNSISRGTFYNLKATGAGPREKRAMGRVLITKESAQEWRASQ
jgi:hypothetical protein